MMSLSLYRLMPPRPTFPSDMTPDEAQVMHEHALYWRQFAASGKVLVVGPVADPEGAFGIAIIVGEEGEDLGPLCKADPAIKSGLGFSYKLHLMPKFILSSKVSS
jgi:uncharacterized protein YciI